MKISHYSPTSIIRTSVQIIKSLDNQGKAIVFSIALSMLTCSDNGEVRIIEVRIIEVGLYTVFCMQLNH